MIDIADQLADASEKETLSGQDRKKALNVYLSLRKSLIKKLKTEKIIRENKDLLENDELLKNLLDDNILNTEILKIEAETNQLSSGLIDAIKFSTEVQKEFNELLADNS